MLVCAESQCGSADGVVNRWDIRNPAQTISTVVNVSTVCAVLHSLLICTLQWQRILRSDEGTALRCRRGAFAESTANAIVSEVRVVSLHIL